jgi:hypothetical protein
VGSYILARSRNSTQAVDLELSARRGIAKLRLLPSNPDSNQSYTAHLTRLIPGGGRQPLGEVSGLVASSADLYVTLYVDSSSLPDGDYELSLDAQKTPAASAQRDRFTLRLP